MKQGGCHANNSGKMLESIVENCFREKNFKIINYKQWQNNKNKFRDNLLIKRIPYKSIYGHNSKTEFLILSYEFNIKTRIECRWQQVSGSVDEKLPYLFLNCAQKMTEPHIIILSDGGGVS